jgi:hypothetical protein
MPVTFELGPEAHRCTIHMSGLLTLADLEQGVDLQIAAGAWTRQTIIDTTDATGMTVVFSGILELVVFMRRRVQGLPPRGPVVIIAPVPAVYGVARMYQVAMEEALPSITIEVVRSRKDATDWLALAGQH